MVNYLSLLFLTSLVYMAVSTTYYVIPDHYSVHNYTNSNTFTLQHYLNNTSRYFVSHNRLHFLAGQYYMNSDLVFKEIYNFTLTGHPINQSVIICSSPASILVINADSFVVQNIFLINCISLLNNEFYVSVHFSYCSFVIMQNVHVNVSSDAPKTLVGIYEMNVAISIIINVKVQINILKCHHHPIKINGLTIYYNGSAKVHLPSVRIEAFDYYSQKSCLKYSQNAIQCIILTSPFAVLIENTVFANLTNSSALHYYGKVYADNTQRISYLLIINVTVMHNTGNGYLKMFHIMLRSSTSNYIIKVESIAGFTDLFRFYNCSFAGNTNIETMIYVEPLSYSRQGCIEIERSTFQNNTDVCFLKFSKNYAITRNLVASV